MEDDALCISPGASGRVLALSGRNADGRGGRDLEPGAAAPAVEDFGIRGPPPTHPPTRPSPERSTCASLRGRARR